MLHRRVGLALDASCALDHRAGQYVARELADDRVVPLRILTNCRAGYGLARPDIAGRRPALAPNMGG